MFDNVEGIININVPYKILFFMGQCQMSVTTGRFQVEDGRSYLIIMSIQFRLIVFRQNLCVTE